METMIRPRQRRLARPIIAATVLASLFLLCTAGAAVNHLGTDRPADRVLLAVAVALVVIPLGLFLVQVAMSARNVFLRSAQGRLALGEWTGRVVEVAHPRSVRVYPVGNSGAAGRLAVVSGGPGEPPLLLNPAWWDGAELHRVLAGLHLPVTEAAPTVLPAIAREHPGVRLPFSARHPAVFILGSIAAGIGWLFTMMYLITHI